MSPLDRTLSPEAAPPVRRLLLTGQCTLHWGRMEFGNIGNYYILEPLVRELHRVFPDAEIRTTFQLSTDFCTRERVTVLPMELYHGWQPGDRAQAESELAAARQFAATGQLPLSTPYLREVQAADLMVDFSGDLWGDNARFLGADRLHIGLCKDRAAQLLGKPVVLLAGSPGPFRAGPERELAREVFAHFAWVANREPLSRQLLAVDGFRVDHVSDCACPAFLFASSGAAEAAACLAREGVRRRNRPVFAFILCGWNFARGPFDCWPREDEEFEPFLAAAQCATQELGADLWLLSHANGFAPPPAPFELQPGRDFPLAARLYELLRSTPSASHVSLLRGPFTPAQTKALLGQCDLLIAGRVHGAVGGLSQHVPTLIIDYGHEPRAHKLHGIAQTAGVADCVAPPEPDALVARLRWCAREQAVLRARLARQIPRTQALARANFDPLPALVAARTSRRSP